MVPKRKNKTGETEKINVSAIYNGVDCYVHVAYFTSDVTLTLSAHNTFIVKLLLQCTLVYKNCLTRVCCINLPQQHDVKDVNDDDDGGSKSKKAKNVGPQKEDEEIQR